MLPELFLEQMKMLLKEEYSAFLQSYDRDRTPSLRRNCQKDKNDTLQSKADFLMEQVPWTKNGFYYKEEGRPGKHPFHEAGVYYIQEASAMAPAEYLQAAPGELVLDLCAAPGGKSTQLADSMQGSGLLVCNEINSARAKILSENIERMGVRNALVTNHDPAVLAERFQECFDKILVDAPCSGEGMFRKNENAAQEWSNENVMMCAERQKDILDAAAVMLKPGGRLVYSTCTFALPEDEGTISSFTDRHPEFSIEKPFRYPGMEKGIDFEGNRPELENTIRLWPHKLKGEGHFTAVLHKRGKTDEGEEDSTAERELPWREQKGRREKEYPEWIQFKTDFLQCSLPGIYITFGDQLYLAPEILPDLKGLRVLRPGLHLGTIKKGRFEPSHALALTLQPENVKYSCKLSVEEATSYLKGETFRTEGEKGWYLITVEGYSLGWGKLSDGTMKNHYPRGLRW